MARYKIRRRRNVNIIRVVMKLVGTIVALWVGGIILEVFGDVINGTSSGFYRGLTLIGWTVNTSTNQVTATDDGGVIVVIGIIGLASVVFEFVTISRL